MMALSPGEMHDRIIENLEAKTGHALDHWLSVVNTQRRERSDKYIVGYLKAEHGLGHYTAFAIVKEASSGNEYSATEDLVAALFAEKPNAKSLYDTLDARVTAMPRVERIACKTYVGYRAKTQFLVIAPSGKDGLRCGLALAPDAIGLSPASSFGSARIRSRFEIGHDGPTSEQWLQINEAHRQNS